MYRGRFSMLVRRISTSNRWPLSSLNPVEYLPFKLTKSTQNRWTISSRNLFEKLAFKQKPTSHSSPNPSECFFGHSKCQIFAKGERKFKKYLSSSCIFTIFISFSSVLNEEFRRSWRPIQALDCQEWSSWSCGHSFWWIWDNIFCHVRLHLNSIVLRLLTWSKRAFFYNQFEGNSWMSSWQLSPKFGNSFRVIREIENVIVPIIHSLFYPFSFRLR